MSGNLQVEVMLTKDEIDEILFALGCSIRYAVAIKSQSETTLRQSSDYY